MSRRARRFAAIEKEGEIERLLAELTLRKRCRWRRNVREETVAAGVRFADGGENSPNESRNWKEHA